MLATRGSTIATWSARRQRAGVECVRGQEHGEGEVLEEEDIGLTVQEHPHGPCDRCVLSSLITAATKPNPVAAEHPRARPSGWRWVADPSCR